MHPVTTFRSRRRRRVSRLAHGMQSEILGLPKLITASKEAVLYHFLSVTHDDKALGVKVTPTQ